VAASRPKRRYVSSSSGPEVSELVRTGGSAQVWQSIAVMLIALVALAGLVEDSLNAFAFTRSVRSWPLWAGGLVLGGLVYAIAETGFEWITAADQTTDALARRVMRSLMAAAFVSGLLIGVLLFHRVFSGRNSFVPVIVGRVTQGEGGAVIQGHMRLAIFVAVLMTVWIGGTLTAAITEVPRAIAAHAVSGACLVALFPLFGAVLVTTGYYPERRKAMRLLLDAFQPSSTPAPQSFGSAASRSKTS